MLDYLRTSQLQTAFLDGCLLLDSILLIIEGKIAKALSLDNVKFPDQHKGTYF